MSDSQRFAAVTLWLKPEALFSVQTVTIRRVHRWKRVEPKGERNIDENLVSCNSSLMIISVLVVSLFPLFCNCVL